jgi:hypothetical protein
MQLTSKFSALCELMGWDNKSAAYTPRANGQGNQATIGHTFLEHNSVYGWPVNQLVNESGGESRLKESCSAAEMYAWLSGACFAAYELKKARR